MPKTKFVPEISILCEKDEYCRLVNKEIRCSTCQPCDIDYTNDRYIPVNFSSFNKYSRQYLKEKCPDFFERLETPLWRFHEGNKCDGYWICPECEPVVKNNNFRAVCINKQCVKIKK